MADKKKINYLHPQAFLMHRVGRMRTGPMQNGLLKKNIAESKKFKYEYVRRISGTYTPETVMNRLMQSPTKSDSDNPANSFFNLQTHKLSMLVPEIKFYKVDGDKRIPFYFPIVSNLNPLEGSSSDAPGAYFGGSSVIKNFDVKLMGSDPFTAKKYLEATLVIKVDSLANIFLDQRGYARLADLFTISHPKSKVHRNVGQAISAGQIARPMEVMAVLGYALRDYENIFTDQEISEVRKNIMILRMNVGDHTINVDKDGMATITIKYVARISSLEENRAAFNIVGDAASAAKEAEIKVSEEDEAESEDLTFTAEERKRREKAKAEAAKTKLIDKIKQVRKISEFLEDRGRFFSLKSTPQMLNDYYNAPGQSDDAKAAGSATSAVPLAGAPSSTPTKSDSTKKNKDHSLSKLQSLESANRTFHYVLFGDMIEAFCRRRKKVLEETVEKIKSSDETSEKKAKKLKIITDSQKKLKKLKILLPNVKLVWPKGRPHVINLADIPISSGLYQKYVFNEIINTKGTTYSVNDFLGHCANKILPQAIGGFAGKAPGIIKNTKQVFAHTTFTGAKANTILGSSRIDVENFKGPNYVSSSPPSNEEEYFLIYPEPDAKVPSSRSGNEDRDFKDNIYHFQLGKDRGIIKGVSFNKFTVPFRQESLMTNQVGLYDELKMPYSATISMFGNMLFFPGSQVYIDPFALGFGDPRNPNAAAADLGLGGYYVVLEVNTTYSSDGTLNTKLTCSFASWPDPRSIEDASGDVEPKPEVEATASNDESPDTDGDGAPTYPSAQDDSYVGTTVQTSNLFTPLTAPNLALNSYSSRNTEGDA